MDVTNGYESLSTEELIEKLNERDLLVATLQSEKAETAKSVTDLTAERDSLSGELNTLKENHAATLEELKSTKELNFTLGRQVSGDKQIDGETLLHEMFGRKEVK